MEFLARIDVNLPPDMDPGAAEELRTRERERGKELWGAGVIQRIWRIPGKRAVLGLYRAESATSLQEVFESFPMYPYLDITVYPLADHALEQEPRH